MSRQLFLLNVLLLALIGLTGWRLRETLREGERRIEEMRARTAQPAPVVAPPPLPAVAPAVAANYFEVARTYMFSRDRNPNVIVEPEPVVQKPPMPPLPAAHGLMMFGDKPTVILSLQGTTQRGYRAGDQVGPFKLLSVDTQNIVFEWDGQKVVRKLSEIAARPNDGAPTQMQGGVITTTSTGGSGQTAPMTATQAAPAAATSNFQQGGPGADIGAGYRACQVGDTSPSGTVVNGYRKVMVDLPFGRSCRWEVAR
jgi:hypothetical protein